MSDMHISTAQAKPSLIGQWISKLKNAAMTPADAMLGSSDVMQLVERLWTPYHERMKQVSAMDFDDLLGNFLQILKEHPAVAERYQSRFPWLLVDEFQDTNRVQYDLLKLLCPAPGNLCVVGDPDQSIYGFRGAEVRNILDFERDYETTTIVRLEQNYRSTANILRGAETVIANNTQRLDKRLRTDAEAGPPILRLKATGSTEEAATVVDRIQALAEEGESLEEVAVFYRAHWLSRALEQALKDKGVPYEIVGGQTFFERREIKDLLAFLRVLVNPLDDVSMGRVVNVPPRGLGKVSLEKLRQAAFAEGMSLREAVGEKSLHGVLGKKAQKGLAELAETLDKAQAASAHGAHAALKVILDGTHYVRHATGFGDAEDSTREENIAELVSDHGAVRRRAGRRRARRRSRQRPGRLPAARRAADVGRPRWRRSVSAHDDGARRQGSRVRPRVRLRPRGGCVPEYANRGRSRRARGRTAVDVRCADTRPPDADAEFGQGAAGQRQHGVDGARRVSCASCRRICSRTSRPRGGDMTSTTTAPTAPVGA